MTNMASIRLLLKVAVQYDLLIYHMDVKSAYLNALIDYEIYVDPPLKVKIGIMFVNLKNPPMC